MYREHVMLACRVESQTIHICLHRHTHKCVYIYIYTCLYIYLTHSRQYIDYDIRIKIPLKVYLVLTQNVKANTTWEQIRKVLGRCFVPDTSITHPIYHDAHIEWRADYYCHCYDCYHSALYADMRVHICIHIYIYIHFAWRARSNKHEAKPANEENTTRTQSSLL